MGSWLPLESSPDILNPFIRKLGLPEPWGFADVFGLDEELLVMVPPGCVALCLLYPSTNISGVRRADQKAAIEAGAQPPAPDNLFFCMQHDGIGNACGTIACIHAVVNGVGVSELTDGPLKNFVASTAGMSASDRGKALLTATELQEMSDATAASGETEGAGTDDAQGQHFIAFVNAGGMLYECDGRNFDKAADGSVAMPYCHGATSDDTFLSDAAKVIREDVMARDPSSINFNIVALCKDAM